jgi:hypothetical protein
MSQKLDFSIKKSRIQAVTVAVLPWKYQRRVLGRSRFWWEASHRKADRMKIHTHLRSLSFRKSRRISRPHRPFETHKLSKIPMINLIYLPRSFYNTPI